MAAIILLADGAILVPSLVSGLFWVVIGRLRLGGDGCGLNGTNGTNIESSFVSSYAKVCF